MQYKINQVDIVEEGKYLVRVKTQYNDTAFMG